MYPQPSTTLQNSTPKRAGENPESISSSIMEYSPDTKTSFKTPSLSVACLETEQNAWPVRPLYPEWPHRQCIGLAFRRSRVHGSLAAANLAISSQNVHRAIRGAYEVLPRGGGGVTASQFDLPSLTPLFVAGCGRLQLGAHHWATSVALLQAVDN